MKITDELNKMQDSDFLDLQKRLPKQSWWRWLLRKLNLLKTNEEELVWVSVDKPEAMTRNLKEIVKKEKIT